MAHNFGQLCTIFVVVLWELTIAALWQPANVIADAAGRVYIIDWEWAGPGDRLCDLATFCALSEQDDAGELALLARYLGNEATSGAGLERLGGWGAGCSPLTSSRVNTCAVSSQLTFTRTLTRGAGWEGYFADPRSTVPAFGSGAPGLHCVAHFGPAAKPPAHTLGLQQVLMTITTPSPRYAAAAVTEPCAAARERVSRSAPPPISQSVAIV